MREFLAIPNIDLYITISILFVFGLVEFILGHYKNSGRRSDDWILEGIGFFVVAGTKSLIVAAVYFLGRAMAPGYFETLSIFATFLIIYCVINAWSYWIIVDVLSIVLYVMTQAYLLAILYVAYLISNSLMWRQWTLDYKQQSLKKQQSVLLRDR